MTTGEYIRSLRKACGTTQQEVAIACNSSVMAVSDWELDKKFPRRPALQKLAEFFDVPIGTFIDESQRSEQPPAPKEVIIVTQPEWKTLDYLTPNQVGKILQIGRDSAYELVRSLPHLKIGKQYRVARETFEKYLNNTQKG